MATVTDDTITFSTNPDSVDYMRDELQNALPTYQLIDDCLAGQSTIKAQTTRYLPKPGVFAQADQTVYDAYLQRAVFYGVAKRTLDGMVGEVFAHDPLVDVKSNNALQVVLDDVTGAGMPINQLAKKAVRNVLAKGRIGLLTDYPQTQGSQSRAQLATGEIRPVFVLYQAEAVINWHTFKRGSRELLDLVVLQELENRSVGLFGEKAFTNFRVLRLIDNEYTVEIWKVDEQNTLVSVDTFTPTDGAGKPFNEIPFTFIGAENNDPDIDPAPMYDLCELNIAHFRNSADYEDSCFKLGQPTPWFSGLTQEWVKNVMNGVVSLGANGVISLPVGAAAGLLQAAPNTMIKEAMDGKERQMVALGARLVEQQSVQRTATDAKMERASETSALASVAGNVSTGFRWALQWAGWFLNGKNDLQIKFELNQKFDLAKATPDEVRATIEAWQKSALTFGEMRDTMRRAEMASLPDDKAQAEIQKENEAQLALAVQKADALGFGGNNTVNSGGNPNG